METSQALRLRMPRLGLALCVALLGACVGPTPHLRFQLIGEWEMWNSGNNNTIFHPVGEPLEDCTELIVIKKVRRPIVGASSPSEWFDAYDENLRENQPGDTITMIRETPLGILFEGAEQLEGEPNAKFVGRLLDKKATRWIIKYYVRVPKEMTASLREEWIDWLLEAWISDEPP